MMHLVIVFENTKNWMYKILTRRPYFFLSFVQYSSVNQQTKNVKVQNKKRFGSQG